MSTIVKELVFVKSQAKQKVHALADKRFFRDFSAGLV
jgi:hypothetical protein